MKETKPVPCSQPSRAPAAYGGKSCLLAPQALQARLSLHFPSSDIRASSPQLPLTELIPTSGHLHLLVPRPGMPFPQLLPWLFLQLSPQSRPDPHLITLSHSCFIHSRAHHVRRTFICLPVPGVSLKCELHKRSD